MRAVWCVCTSVLGSLAGPDVVALYVFDSEAESMTTISFKQPDKRLSLNDREHWAVKARKAKAWRDRATWAAQGVPMRDRCKPRSFVEVTFPVKQNRRRDPHNAIATVKPIIDGLVDAGVWPDDTDEYVIVLDPKFDKRDDELVIVRLTPVPEVAA